MASLKKIWIILVLLAFIDSVLRIDKKNSPQAYLEECKYKIKKILMSRCINTELDLDSESYSDSDDELMTKLKSDSDNSSDNGSE